MANLRTDTGRHVWVEIRSGGRYVQAEAYLCVRCGQRRLVPWNGSPDLLGCVKGDALFDRSIVHRQPQWVGPPIPGWIAIMDQFPALILFSEEDGNLWPIVYQKDGDRGMIVARNPYEMKLAECRVLASAPDQKFRFRTIEFTRSEYAMIPRAWPEFELDSGCEGFWMCWTENPLEGIQGEFYSWTPQDSPLAL